MRYPASEKIEIIRRVEQSHLSICATLEKIGIPRATFYRWYDLYQTGGPETLDDRSPRPGRVCCGRGQRTDRSSGFPAELPLEVRVRGVDTPETGSKARCQAERVLADRATAFTSAAMRSGQVTFRNLAWDKYGGRIDATVLVNGEDLAKAPIRNGLARSYNGEKRTGWCKP